MAEAPELAFRDRLRGLIYQTPDVCRRERLMVCVSNQRTEGVNNDD